jgi:NADH-quinone oxidoreductase subunit N
MGTLICLAILGILVLYLGFLKRRSVLVPVAIAGLLLAIILTLTGWNPGTALFSNMMVIDRFSKAFTVSMLVTTIVIFLFAERFYRQAQFNLAEIYALTIFSLFGAIMLTSFQNLTMLFLGLETMSIPLYILAGSRKLSVRSNEASFKYYILGSFATAVFLLGVTFIYGAAVSFDIPTISAYIINNQQALPGFFKLGLVLVLVSFLFKVAAVPFHFWTPDVYSGSPTLITAFMASVVKTATFAAFWKLYGGCFAAVSPVWTNTIWIVTALTLVISNLAALKQEGIKRLLAYSSISHTGFMVMGILAMNQLSQGAIFFYTLAYSMATVTVFGIVILVRDHNNSNDAAYIFRGLVLNNKFLSFILLMGLFSMAGIPVTAGFFAKYYVILAALQSHFIILAIIAVLSALIGIYYYFRLINQVFAKDNTFKTIPLSFSYKIGLILATAITLCAGLIPGVFLNLV